MKKSKFFRTTTQLFAFIFLLCLTYSCQQVEEGITEEEAKALVDSDHEVWNGGDLSLFDEIFSADIVYHTGGGDTLVGTEAIKEHVSSWRESSPDYNQTLDELIITGDRIVFRWTMTYTTTGPSGDLPPTKIKISGVTINYIVDGKISEQWHFFNTADLATQLGYTITPPSTEGEEE